MSQRTVTGPFKEFPDDYENEIVATKEALAAVEKALRMWIDAGPDCLDDDELDGGVIYGTNASSRIGLIGSARLALKAAVNSHGEQVRMAFDDV